MKVVRIILLILIIVGIGLLFAQGFWVPKLVDMILKSEQTTTNTASTIPETKNWSTITLENVIISYPPTLQASASPEYHSVQLYVPGGEADTPRPQISIETHDNPGNLSLAEFLADPNQESGLSSEFASGDYSVITVNGHQAYRFVLRDVPAVTVVVSSPGKFIKVSDGDMAFQATGEFEKILERLIIKK